MRISMGSFYIKQLLTQKITLLPALTRNYIEL